MDWLSYFLLMKIVNGISLLSWKSQNHTFQKIAFQYLMIFLVGFFVSWWKTLALLRRYIIGILMVDFLRRNILIFLLLLGSLLINFYSKK